MKLKTVKSILAAALCAAVGFAASAAEPIEYLDWDAENGKMTNAVCTTYEVVTADTFVFEDGKWYVVTNGSEIARDERIYSSGSAHLILCDGGSLAVQGSEYTAGVTVQYDYALTIYGQTGGAGSWSPVVGGLPASAVAITGPAAR